MRITVLGRGIYAYNLIRLLQKYILTLATTDKQDFAKESVRIKNVLFLTNPSNDYDKYMEELSCLNNDIVFCVGEETFYWQKKDTIMTNVLMKLHSKWDFMDLCNVCDIKIPKTIKIEELSSVVSIEKDVVIKPLFTRGQQDSYYWRKGKLLNNKKEIIDMPKTSNIHFVAQEDLDDDNCERHYSGFSYCDDGIIIKHVSYQSLCPVDGYATVRITKNIPEIEMIMHKIISHQHYSGFIGIDFIEKNGIYYPIECNPRCTNGITLFDGDLFGKLELFRASCSPLLLLFNYWYSLMAWYYLLTTKWDNFEWSDPYILPAQILLMTNNIIDWIFYGYGSLTNYLKKKIINEIVIYPPMNSMICDDESY